MSRELNAYHRRDGKTYRKPTPFFNFNDPVRYLSVSALKSNLNSRTPFEFLPTIRDSFLLKYIAGPENLMVAWLKQVQSGSTASGPDGITLDVSTGWAWKIVRHLSMEVLDGRYHPGKTRDVPVPKSSGGTRTIQIPNVRDRVLGSAIASALKPLFARSLEGFYGRSRETILAKLKCEAEHYNRFHMIQDDIRNCFPTINREKLMDVVTEKSREWCTTGLPPETFGILDLIQRIIQGPPGVREQTGVVQGGTLSPLLLEILLHNTVDSRHHDESPNTTLCRYVDDICILGQRPSDAQEAMDIVRQTVIQNGQELKGKDTGIYDLRSNSPEDRPTVLGLSPEWENGQITYSLREESWAHLEDLLEESHAQGNVKETTMMTVKGWAQSIAPCIRKSTGQQISSRIRKVIRNHHIDTRRDPQIPALIESIGERWKNLIIKTKAQIQQVQPDRGESTCRNLSGTLNGNQTNTEGY